MPVLKKSNVCGSFNDFRPLTTVFVIAQFLEYRLINKLSNCMSMHELKFRFTKGGGCYKDLLVFKTVVEYYNNHRSAVFVASLDLTKAYDILNQRILIIKFYDTGVLRL